MITDSTIGYGDMLGAQMITYANLYYIARETGQELVFWEELINFRRGLRFFRVFDLQAGRLVKSGRILRAISRIYCKIFCQQKESWEKNMKRIYFSRILTRLDDYFLCFIRRMHRDYLRLRGNHNVHCDKKLLKLDNARNYDIWGGFGTYQDWKKYEKEIVKEFRFKDAIVRKGQAIWDSFHIAQGRETVSVHFRRTDYLVIASLNLSIEYYKKALREFNDSRYLFLVFSDDIGSIKRQNIFGKRDVIYVDNHSDAVDMYLMTLCDHNIIANSSFSFWGGY